MTTRPPRLPRRIGSPRLVIRCWEPADVDVLQRAVAESTEHLRPWMPWIADEPLDRSARRALIEEWEAAWASGGDAVYGVFLRAEPDAPDTGPVVVGGTGLHRRLGPRGLEIGYWVHAHHTRRGYATEIARAVTHAAFDDPAVDHVEIHHDRNNEASAGIPRKLGFRYAGNRRSEKAAAAETGVESIWRTTRTEWLGDRR